MPLATVENTNKLGRMNELIDSLIKQAMEGDSAPANDPPTAHAVGNVSTEVPATEGSHAAGTEAEVKAEVGETAVEESDTKTDQPTPENTDVTVTGPNEAPPEGQPNKAMDDPGTSHPAKATVGIKHSSWTLDTVSKAGNNLLAKIAMLLPDSNKSSSEQAGIKAASESVKQLNAAGSLSPEQLTIVAALEKQGTDSGYKVGQYLQGFVNGAQEAIKEAEEEESDKKEDSEEKEDKSEDKSEDKAEYTEGNVPMIAEMPCDKAASANNPVSNDQMAQLLLKAAMDLGAMGAMGSGGEYADPGMGGGMEGGGAPPMPMGAPEAANPGGMSESEEDQLAALIQQIMAETGMSLEEVMSSLMALAQGGGGEMGGGGAVPAPAAEAAAPVEGPGAMMGAEPAKVASARVTPQQVQKALRDLLQVK